MFTLGLFLTTLQSFHIASASGAPLTAVGAVILFLQCGKKFRKPDLVDVVLILILLIAASVGMYSLSSSVIAEQKITNLIGWFLSAATLIIDLDGKVARMIVAVRNVLILHVIFFLTQVLIYVASGYYVDACVYPLDCTMRYAGGDFDVLNASPIGIRPTGLFEEPSTYSTVVLILALVLYLYKRRLYPIVLLALVTSFLTFSSWSFVALVFCGLFFCRNVRSLLAALATGSVVYLLYFDWFWTRAFVQTYETGQTPAVSRTYVATWIMDQTMEAPLGTGIGVLMEKASPSDVLSLYDSGVVMYLVYVFGFLGFVIAGLLIFSVNDARKRLLMLFLLASKLNPVYPFFWIMVNLLRTTTPDDSKVAEVASDRAAPAEARQAEVR